MSDFKKVLFRVDANRQIGMGHLQRCLSLARAMLLKGLEVFFLIKDDEGANERVGQYGFAFHNLQSNLTLGEDLQETLTYLGNGNFHILIADSYDFDHNYLSALRQGGYYVAFLDDLAQMGFPCQVVINGGVYAEELPYRSLNGDTQFLLGPKYILLREEFWNIPKRKIKSKIEKILVTVGGADPSNVTPTILNVLSTVSSDFDVDVIIGPFFDNISEIESAGMRFERGQVQLVPSPTSVRDLMLGCDLAISGGGQTLYELAATGTPTIALKLADNQEGNLRGMTKAGVIGVIDKVNHLMISVLNLSYGSLERRNMSIAGQRLVSGGGAMTVTQLILSSKLS